MFEKTTAAIVFEMLSDPKLVGMDKFHKEAFFSAMETTRPRRFQVPGKPFHFDERNGLFCPSMERTEENLSVVRAFNEKYYHIICPQVGEMEMATTVGDEDEVAVSEGAAA